MFLSKNFKFKELINTNTGLSNNPNSQEKNNLLYLCQYILQPIRDWNNDVVSISSGFRSDLVNSSIGGSKTSQHLLGQAADIIPHGKDIDIVYEWCLDNLKFGQCINETSKSGSRWIHISLPRLNKPNQMALVFDGTKYEVYKR